VIELQTLMHTPHINLCGYLSLRWRILKTGIRLHGFAIVDDIWKTCCALHNMLLEDDGRDESWEMGVQGDWESELGLHDRVDSATFGVPRNFDSSINGGVIQTQPPDHTGQPTSLTVRHMPLAMF